MSLPPRFKFYEEVRITSSRPETVSVEGVVGVIFGVSEQEGSWSYAVFILRLSEVWGLDEAEIESTGVCYSREDFYSGESIRVEVDANGQSTLID